MFASAAETSAASENWQPNFQGDGHCLVHGRNGWVEYDYALPPCGLASATPGRSPWELTVSARMNSAEPRPLKLFVNGRLATDTFAGATTGSWNDPAKLQWSSSGPLKMADFDFGSGGSEDGGRLRLRLEPADDDDAKEGGGGGYFPHLSALRIQFTRICTDDEQVELEGREGREGREHKPEQQVQDEVESALYSLLTDDVMGTIIPCLIGGPHGVYGASDEAASDEAASDEAANDGRACPRGHALGSFLTPNCSFSCDGDGCTQRRLPPGTVMYGCRACNYDLCWDCFIVAGDSGSGSVAAAPDASLSPLAQLEQLDRQIASRRIQLERIRAAEACASQHHRVRMAALQQKARALHLHQLRAEKADRARAWRHAERAVGLAGTLKALEEKRLETDRVVTVAAAQQKESEAELEVEAEAEKQAGKQLEEEELQQKAQEPSPVHPAPPANPAPLTPLNPPTHCTPVRRPAPTAQGPSCRWAAELAQLGDMGFYDKDALAVMLDQTNGNVQRVVELQF